MNLILLGAPGAGKGTQAEIICAKLNIPSISTGNILRAAVKEGTEMGLKAKSFMDAGALVPDEVIIGILKERLAQADCANGFILDGVPRTIAQAEAIETMGIRIDKVLELQVEDSVIVERMSGRRVCEKCGASYHILNKKSKVEGVCDLCGGKTVIRNGQISYNDPSSYRRTTVSDGLTVRYDAAKYSVSSITSYQYSDDEMTLDQDFTPEPWFTLRQARREHALTEDIVFRSHDGRRYGWLLGAFGFYRHGVMEAPVHFKRTGIEELIVKNANEHLGAIWNEEYSISADELPLYSDFRMPVYGGAVYHESNLRLGRWRLTAGIRFDVEHTSLAYHSRTDMDYFVSKEGGAPAPKRISIDEGNRIAHTYCEVLPKVSLLYAFDEVRNLYISVAKGYKAGGFNTQMFSDILSEKLKWRMAGSQYDEADLMSYEPEYSWNYELGGHFSCMDGAVRGDFAVFYIDVRDQQLTIFPEGQSTGRMMTNAGRTRSVGAEAALQFAPWRSLEINTAYGYTDARFVRYDNGIEDFKDNRIPYAPQHTLSAQAAWTLPTGVKWLGDVVLQAGVRCAGRIWWNEENTLSQPFYALADASVRFEHKHYSLDIWGRNLGGARYDVFYFKSIGNEFVQRGRPRTFGITLNINI